MPPGPKPQAKQNKPPKNQPKSNKKPRNNKKLEGTVLFPRQQFLSYGLPGGKCTSGTFNFIFKIGFVLTFLTIDSDFFELASKDRSK